MRTIAIDARKYQDFGIGTYIQHLLNQLGRLATSHSFLVYAFPNDVDKIRVGDSMRVVPVSYGKYSFKEIGLLGFKARREGVDVFHAPHYTLPIGLRGHSVVTIHDLIHLRFPELFGFARSGVAHAMIRHAVSNAGAVIVDSAFVKQDLVELFRVEEKNINVVHLGVHDDFFRSIAQEGVDDFRRRFRLHQPMLLFVGNLKAHKGIQILFKAVQIVRQSIPAVQLVLAGSALAQSPDIVRLIQQLNIAQHVQGVDFLSPQDLLHAYRAADVFVLPSQYEGFGFPALEAMAAGTPTIVSNAGSLPEVVGRAAMIFETGNAEELADLITEVLSNSSLRSQLKYQGIEQARKFDWSETAQKTLRVYESLL
jgi:glycosyltransferase involved in cell wall biosynthesis